MQLTSPWVYLNFQSNKKFFRDYFSRPLRPGRVRGRRRRLPRGRFVSRAFSTPSYVSPLSLMAPCHSFRCISFTELAYRSPLLSVTFPQPPVSYPPSRIVADFLYLLHDLSPDLSTTVTVVPCSPRPSLRVTALPPCHPHLFRKIPRESDDISRVDVTAARGRWLFYDRQPSRYLPYSPCYTR